MLLVNVVASFNAPLHVLSAVTGWVPHSFCPSWWLCYWWHASHCLGFMMYRSPSI